MYLLVYYLVCFCRRKGSLEGSIDRVGICFGPWIWGDISRFFDDVGGFMPGRIGYEDNRLGREEDWCGKKSDLV